MSAFKKLLEEENEKYLKQVDLITSNLDELLNNKLYNFIKYAETNDISYLEKETEKLKRKNLDTSKENEDPNSSVLPQKKTNQKKTVIKQEKISINSVDSSASIATTTSISKTSMRKDDSIGNIETANMPAPSKLPPKKKKVKTEPIDTTIRSTRSKMKPKSTFESSQKISDRGKPSNVIVQNETITMINITEDTDPQPEIKIKDEPSDHDHLSARSTRTKTRQKNNQSSDRGKPSDVIVQNTTVTMIDITEDNDPQPEIKIKDEQSDPDQLSTRTTRTKTRQKKNQEVEQSKKEMAAEPAKSKTRHFKRINSSSSNEDVVNTKRSKSTSSTNQIDCEENVFESSDFENPDMNINSTTVVKTSKIIQNTEVQEEPEAKKKNLKTPPRTKSKKQQIKEIFSPYEKSSLKKKIEAFEKFGSASKKSVTAASQIPVPKENGTSSNPGSAIKTKPYTPFSSKFMPKTCSTSLHKNYPDKLKKSLHTDSGLSMRSLSAMKASQAEFREREKQRQEKEIEAQLKKDAILQAQAEETKRKREERQLKAQQQREELLEKEKEKQLELQRLKDEKHKQAVTEKEEKLQKIKEEAEKKRLFAKNKAKVLKEKCQRQAAQPSASGLPIYMKTKAPLLPTEDCYDSDDEEQGQRRYKKPYWARDDAINKQLYTQLIAGEKIKNTLFRNTDHNVDLVDMFENIDPRILKRTSSAQWRKPPRYTLFSVTSEIHFSEDSEDEIKC